MSSAASTEEVGRAETAARVGALFRKHGRMVYGISRAMLRDGHEAEDATQQTFLSAHRALLGGACVRDDGAWLATIARNECRARIAVGMRRPLFLGDDDLELIADPADEIQRREHAEALRVALADLPERQREAVVLRDLYGLRYGEVAKALGMSRPATEALLFRARHAMRQRLRPVVTTAIVVPLSVQEGLAQALPGFTAASSGSVVVGAAGGGLLAKLIVGPTGAKVATAAVALATVGAVSTAESERASRDRATHDGAQKPAFVATSGAADSSGAAGARSSGRSRQGEDEGAGQGDDFSSGPGSGGADGGGSSSGGGSGSDDSSEDVTGEGGSSGPESGGDSAEDASGQGSGGSSGKGSGDDATTSDDDGSSGPSSRDPVDDGSPSSNASSGEGSGDDASTIPAEQADETDSSGHGSGGDSGKDGSESGKSSGDDDGQPPG